jgi:hypothetical protein
MASRSEIALATVLQVMRPLVRLLLRNGVTFTTLSTALKPVFIDAARAELARQQMPQTDSAVTLLCGVHRRDVRQLSRPASAQAVVVRESVSLVGQVIGRWMTDDRWLGADGSPRPLGRIADGDGFDALVSSVSLDVRPRAMLDEMLRLGVVTVDDAGVRLVAEGFAPRQGLEASAALLAANLHDHAAAAVDNVTLGANFLEQAVYVDELTPESIEALRRTVRRASQQAFKSVLREAQLRFDGDAAHAEPSARHQRARFGMFFFSDSDPPKD